jgi:hypothetical protein
MRNGLNKYYRQRNIASIASQQYCTVLAVLVRVYRLHHSIVHSLLLPTPRVGIRIIPLQSILTPWCRVSWRSVDVFPLRLLLPHSLTASSVLTYFCQNPCLKADLVWPETRLTIPVTAETSVVLAHCVAVDLFSVFRVLEGDRCLGMDVSVDSRPLHSSVRLSQY